MLNITVFRPAWMNLTLRRILKSAFNNASAEDQILRAGGFVPWWVKYSAEAAGHSYPALEGIERAFYSKEDTSEEFIATLSEYNSVIDADSSPFGALANASVFQHVPLKREILPESRAAAPAVGK